MVVTAKTLEGLADVRQANLEADIATELASRLVISPEEALEKYYSSPIAGMVAENEYGAQYLDAKYLADEILNAE